MKVSLRAGIAQHRLQRIKNISDFFRLNGDRLDRLVQILDRSGFAKLFQRFAQFVAHLADLRGRLRKRRRDQIQLKTHVLRGDRRGVGGEHALRLVAVDGEADAFPPPNALELVMVACRFAGSGGSRSTRPSMLTVFPSVFRATCSTRPTTTPR